MTVSLKFIRKVREDNVYFTKVRYRCIDLIFFSDKYIILIVIFEIILTLFCEFCLVNIY